MQQVSWKQVHTWRQMQHCLAPRLEYRNWLQAVTRTAAIQAQVLSAAELAIGTRTEKLKRDDIQTALWQKRTLVKTWAMRVTLHLLTANDLPLFTAALSAHPFRNWARFYDAHGISPAQHQALLDAVPEVLGETPLTREQVATAIGKHTGIPKLRALLQASGWGSPLMESALRGDLCFGPSQGQNVTFVNPKKWLADWKMVDPEQAMLQVTRRYLATYGPATPQDFARWWFGEFGLTISKQLFKTLQDELEPVDVEGWHAFVLGSTLSQLQETESADTIRLLPVFDAYTFAHASKREALLPLANMPDVFRTAGWISAVVLVNGQIKGVWDYKVGKQHTDVKVRLFSAPTNLIRNGIEAEAEHLGEFLHSKIVVEYASD